MKYDIKEITTAWEVLGMVGKQELTFNLYKEDENKLNVITELIRSMQNFNGRNNEVVARGLRTLINLLPKVFYNEGNPNNGNYEFSNITVKGDDTIILRAYGRKKENNEEYIKGIERLVNEIGKDINADEKRVLVEEGFSNFQEITIRLWWD